MSNFSPQRHVFKPQCNMEKVAKGFIIAECVISGLVCLTAFMSLSSEKRRYEHMVESKKMANRPYKEGNGWS